MRKWLLVIPVLLAFGLTAILVAGPTETGQKVSSPNEQTAVEGTKQCVWNPGDPHKMHYPQLPDELGWAVNATNPVILADDFECAETGFVKDVHFWGAWRGGVEGQIISFNISFHEDIPANPPNIPYSRPGATLMEFEVPFDAVEAVPIDPPTAEGWYDPTTGLIVQDDHIAYFQYNICLPSDLWFPQEQGTIYWLNISATVVDPQTTQWGWKSSVDHWNDDAVWALWGDLNWVDLWEPEICDTLVNPFDIAIDPTGAFIGGSGGGAYGAGWYFYEMEGWWNIWFYDHPFDSSRFKEGLMIFDVQPVDPAQPSFFEIAVNWSTDLWSIEQPPDDSMPPLPPVDEIRYIGRQTLFLTEFEWGFQEVPYIIEPYNPEWVSVDVRGYNFSVVGDIVHACCPNPQSLDLAFVITGGPEEEIGACCYFDADGVTMLCTETTQLDCTQNLLGVWEGAGTTCQGIEACCLPDGTCIMADALCCVNELGGVPQGPGTQCTDQEACCLADGTCIMADPLCCDDQGGTPQGAGTQCTQEEACCMPDGSCIMLDPLCCIDMGGTPQGPGTTCTQLKPCCMPDGSCMMLDPLCCDDQGGSPSPIGATTCLGDNDGNGTDDACEGGWNPGDPHKMHYPQLPDPAGWDIDASFVSGLADDWQCSETGPVKDIHFWGSWMDGLSSTIDSFRIAIWSDIPADPPTIPYSRPGTMLWNAVITDFGVVEFNPGILEGWYSPFHQTVFTDNHETYYQYNIYLPEQLWFEQVEGTIYWLSINAYPTNHDRFWGWKSSLDHFNDNAVWTDDNYGFWEILYDPLPPFEDPIDLAFVITGGTGQQCDCIPGDANGDLATNLLDITYLINYLYKTGPAPTPYDTCSGDANCDCVVNLLDITFLINYLYKDGTAPCDCLTWVANCGWPLRSGE